MIKRFATVVGGIGLAGALALAACGSGQDPPTSKIFVAPPWNGPERAVYDVVDEGGKLYGICELVTEPGAQTTTVRRLCIDGDQIGYRDDGMAVVDSQTLLPIQSERVQVDLDEREHRTMIGRYESGEAILSRQDVDLDDPSEVLVEVSTDRPLPEPDERSPEPGYYDDESLYWLMRGIPLEEGWEGAYHNVNLGTARIVVAEVKVEDRETVEVPAGEFEAWRIRLRTASITQRFWVEVDSPNRLIQADIERVTYMLRSFE